MVLFGVLAVAFFAVTFFSTKERVLPVSTERQSVGQDLRDLLSNGPWKAMSALALFVFITLSLRGAVIVYYFRYYFGGGELLGRTFGYEGLFSVFNMWSIGAAVVGIVLANPLAARFGRRAVFAVALLASAAFTAAFALVPPGAVGALFGLEGLRHLTYGLTIPLLWAMMADVADYAEWRTGRRATGVVFAGVVFALKAGLGFGGALAGWALASYGYVPNAEQTAGALRGIVHLVSLWPAGVFVAGAGCLLLYTIGRAEEVQIAADLDERRNAAAGIAADPVALVP